MNYKKLLFILLIATGLDSTIFTQNLVANTSVDAAENGDPESIYELILTQLENENPVAVAKLIIRLQIRIDQDATCSTDLSTQAAADMITILGMTDNAKYRKVLDAMDSISLNERQKIVAEQIDWAQKVTDHGLASPYWIAKYGMAVPFLGEKLENTFVPANEWQNKRQAVLDQYKTAINASKTN